MAATSDTTRNVKVRFDGSATGLSRAARQAEKDLQRLRKTADKSLDFTAKSAGITGLVGAIGSLGGPAVAGGVAALGALGAAGGVLALAMSGTGDAVEEFNKALESGDYTEYNKLLAKMPESQREFTKQLIETGQQFKVLKRTAADNALPGITRALESSIELLPVLDKGVERTGKILSDVGDDMSDLFRTDEFKRDLDGFLRATEPVTKSMGKLFVDLTRNVVKFGSEMRPAAEGFAGFIDDLNMGLEGFFTNLGPYAEDFRDVWDGLGGIVRELLPIFGTFFGELSRTWGPILQDFAGWLSENKGEISDWAGAIARATPYLLGLAVGLKVLKAAAAGLDLAKAVGGAFGKIERDAPAKGTRAGTGWGKAFGAAAGILIGAEVIGQLTPGEFQDKGQSLGQFLGNGIGQSARRLVSLDFAGMFQDAQTSAEYLVGRLGGILTSREVKFKLGADPTPANGVVEQTVMTANGKQGVVTIGANGQPAMVTIGGVKYNIDSTTGVMTLAANQNPALGTLNGTKVSVDRTTGTMTLSGNNARALNELGKTTGAVNKASGTVSILASAADAFAKLRGFLSAIPSFVSIGIRAITGRAIGGSIEGFANGGAIRGPGTGTSDSIFGSVNGKTVMLSNGEHILTAREVQKLGGHGAVYALRRAIMSGDLRGFAAGGSVNGSTATSPGTTTVPEVRVYVGDRELKDIVRVEVDQRDRSTRRTVGAGRFPV